MRVGWFVGLVRPLMSGAMAGGVVDVVSCEFVGRKENRERRLHLNNAAMVMRPFSKISLYLNFLEKSLVSISPLP